MNGALIDVENLTKHYPPDVKAVDGISFEIKSGQIFSMLGPNGAGKTTTVEILEVLLNHLFCGLLPELHQLDVSWHVTTFLEGPKMTHAYQNSDVLLWRSSIPTPLQS